LEPIWAFKGKGTLNLIPGIKK